MIHSGGAWLYRWVHNIFFHWTPKKPASVKMALDGKNGANHETEAVPIKHTC